MEFNNLNELKNRLMPALRIKREEINNKNITEEDIWNYLKDTKWRKSNDLSLSDMVNDILKLDINIL